MVLNVLITKQPLSLIPMPLEIDKKLALDGWFDSSCQILIRKTLWFLNI
jgi:hypothetical protein